MTGTVEKEVVDESQSYKAGILDIVSNLNPVDLEQSESEWKKRDDEARDSERQRHYESSGVGDKFLHKRLADFDAYNEDLQKILVTVKEFITDANNGVPRTLWMCGDNGNGKTLLASLIVRETYGHFCRSYEIEDELKDTECYRNQESRTQLYKRYSKYSLLVIDEVARFQGQTELSYLFRILNNRYEAEKPTVLVTNLSREELKNYLGKALYDRFVETCTSVVFNQKSYRTKERMLQN